VQKGDINMAKKRYERGVDVLFDKNVLSVIAISSLIVIYFITQFVIQFVIPYWEVIVATLFYAAIFHIIIRSNRQNSRRKKILQSSIKEIDVMQGTDFEKYLGLLFEKMGYKVEFSPATADYGADLLLKKGGKSIAVQAKRYKSTVGAKAVEQAHSAKSYYDAKEAWVVTNNTFTRNACDMAKKNGVKLVDRGQLINFIMENMTDNSAPTFTIHK
jgi:restriction system protein